MRVERCLTILVILAVMTVGRAGASCSDESLKGSFGIAINGLDPSFLFTASMGLLTMNGTGGVSGTWTTSDNGVITNGVAVTGSYAVEANCLGTVEITPSGGAAQTFEIVIDSTRNLEVIQTNTGYTVSGFGLAQGGVVCTLAALKGIYGFSGNGWDAASPDIPFSIMGESSADGAGNLKGEQVSSNAGTIVTQTLSGTYTVNSDCTGTTTTTTGKGSTNHTNFVVVNSGGTLLQLGTDSGKVSPDLVNRQ